MDIGVEDHVYHLPAHCRVRFFHNENYLFLSFFKPSMLR